MLRVIVAGALALSTVSPGAALADPVAGLANGDFEATSDTADPPGWRAPVAGYVATLDGELPHGGAFAARLAAAADASDRGPFGNLMQSVDATPYRGRTVAFSAWVRTADDPSGQAALWLRVDRPGGARGFFDNMGDRPIRATDWTRYEIVGEVAVDATQLALGMMLRGDGAAWIDDASLEVLEPVGNAPSRPLSGQGAENLAAFARLLAYVRYFHPSDAAAAADWDSFAIAGVQQVEAAGSEQALAETLNRLFQPIAPGLAVATSADALPAWTTSDAPHIGWRHAGVAGGGPEFYNSERVPVASPPEPLLADLGGGVIARIPLAAPVGEDGATLPHADAVPAVFDKPEGYRPTGDDRDARLASTALIWGVLRHFYPYFDVVDVDWDGELSAALGRAATDADADAFHETLQRLVAALEDGHGRVTPARGGGAPLPLAWDWISDRLVVTAVADEGASGVAAGDVVLSIDGRDGAAALADAERLISGSPQFRRSRAVQALRAGEPGPVTLTLERANGERAEVTVRRGSGALPSPVRPDPVSELQPGLLYVDLSRIDGRQLYGHMAELAAARGLVFDLRGYPSGSVWYLQHLTDVPIRSPHFQVPVREAADPLSVEFLPGGWRLTPATPRFTANVAFISDENAISFSESILGTVEDNRLADIVGEPTAGANGNINRFAAPGGYTVIWTGMRVTKGDGGQHHLVGVQPTVPVVPTLEGVRAGRDELLEAAVALVASRMGEEPAP